MIDEIFDDMKDSITSAHDALKREFARVRTGRASPAIMEGLRVDYYGTMTPINQLASIGAPEPRLLIVKVWDKGAVQAVEKAILASDLGLTPQTEGEIIRIPIPPLNEERRLELVKLIKKSGEETKVSIRNSRRDANEMIKQLESDGDLPKDDSKKALKKIQDMTDEGVAQVDKILEAKEKDIMEV